MHAAVMAAGSSGVGGVSPYVTLFVATLAVLAAIAGGVAYFRASYAKATIETLKDSNAALTEKVRIVEQEAEECKARAVALQAEKEHLATYVSGTDAIRALAETLGVQHTETMARMAEIAETIHAHLLVDHDGRAGVRVAPVKKATRSRTASKATTRSAR